MQQLIIILRMNKYFQWKLNRTHSNTIRHLIPRNCRQNAKCHRNMCTFLSETFHRSPLLLPGHQLPNPKNKYMNSIEQHQIECELVSVPFALCHSQNCLCLPKDFIQTWLLSVVVYISNVTLGCYYIIVSLYRKIINFCCHSRCSHPFVKATEEGTSSSHRTHFVIWFLFAHKNMLNHLRPKKFNFLMDKKNVVTNLFRRLPVTELEDTNRTENGKLQCCRNRSTRNKVVCGIHFCNFVENPAPTHRQTTCTWDLQSTRVNNSTFKLIQ